jgi:tRNA pseudouridine55 synthase
VDGERAYDLAREGVELELVPRTVQIHSYRLIGMPDPDHAEFEALVGKGTYIRALARDMALAIGSVGHVSSLRRTACGPFAEANAISLETLAGLGHGPTLRGFLLPIRTALDDIPALALDESEARRFRSGQTLALASLKDRTLVNQDQTVLAVEGERLVALARIEGGVLRSLRVFNDVNIQSQE